MRYKYTCIHRDHGDIHPLYYRNSAGRMVRVPYWYSCPVCIEENSLHPFWHRGPARPSLRILPAQQAGLSVNG